MTHQNNIAIAYGDGIGPEIMTAVLKILEAAKCDLTIDEVTLGKIAYEQGFNSGISEESWEIIKRNKVLLKAPLTTPQGKGFSSVNVAIRKNLGLYANVRPVFSLYPYIKSLHPKMDLIVVRENEEDLYSGIEYKTSPNTTMALKLISQQGCEKIIRYAFEYAQQNGRKKVTCVTKDNIMKISDGMFHNIFDEIAKDYPTLTHDHYIVDIGSARVASKPLEFDVLVTLNLYGDIISDIAAEVSGSVGVAGSANIGLESAMFEAVHGSAPDIAGKKIANPSGLLQAAILMLEYLGQEDKAKVINEAWMNTIKSGIHTADIYNAENSKQKVNTDEFANAVISNLNFDTSIQSAKSNITRVSQSPLTENKEQPKLVGADIYINHSLSNVESLASTLNNIANSTPLALESISFKGMKIWPNKIIQPSFKDLITLRFKGENIKQTDVIQLLNSLNNEGFTISVFHNLFEYKGVKGYRELA